MKRIILAPDWKSGKRPIIWLGRAGEQNYTEVHFPIDEALTADDTIKIFAGETGDPSPHEVTDFYRSGNHEIVWSPTPDEILRCRKCRLTIWLYRGQSRGVTYDCYCKVDPSIDTKFTD